MTIQEFFELHPYITKHGVAHRARIDYDAMRLISMGKAGISEKRLLAIQNAIHDIGADLRKVRLTRSEDPIPKTNKSALIAYKIKEALLDRNISRSQFAKQMKVVPSYITSWLSGKHNFTIETLFSIEEKLNIKLFDL